MPNRGFTEQIYTGNFDALIQSKLPDIKQKVAQGVKAKKIPIDDQDDVVQDAALACFMEAKKSRNMTRADTRIDQAIETAVGRIAKHGNPLVPLEECCATNEIPTDRIAEQMEIPKVLATLPGRDQTVLNLRYGLDSKITFSSNLGDFNMTQAEIGKKLGLSKERIRQIEATALRHLRHPSRKIYLKDINF